MSTEKALPRFNVNAKSFVPGGAPLQFPAFTPADPAAFFRYTATASIFQARPSLSGERIQIGQLLSAGHLVPAPIGGTSAGAQASFASSYFQSLEKDAIGPSRRIGYLLLREQIHPGIPAAVAVREEGYLLPVDIPLADSMEMTPVVEDYWKIFFDAVGGNPLVRGLGHTFTRVRSGTGTYLQHYFFVVADPNETLATEIYTKIGSVARRVLRVPQILRLVLGAVRFNVFAAFDDAESVAAIEEVFEKGKKHLLIVRLSNSVTDFSQQLQDECISRMIAFASEGPVTIYVLLAIRPPSTRKGFTADFWRLLLKATADQFLFLKHFFMPKLPDLIDVGRKRWGAVPPTQAFARTLSRDQLVDCEKLVQWQGQNDDHIYLELLTNALFVNPSKQFSPFTGPAFGAVEDIDVYLSVLALTAKVATATKHRLTRKTFADAAKMVAAAKKPYRVRRNYFGISVLVIIDSYRNIFLVDAETRLHVTQLAGYFDDPLTWSGRLSGTQCVLEGTLVPNFRGQDQFKVIVHDVLVWNNIDRASSELHQRLAFLDDHNALEDELSWSSCSPMGVIILKCQYYAIEKIAALLSGSLPHSESPSIGLVFTPTQPASPLYTWTPEESVTCIFAVGTVEKVAAQAPYEVTRASLLVRPNESDMLTELVPYGDEYVEFVTQCCPGLSNAVLIECLLRREADGSHWWELLRQFSDADFAVPQTTSLADVLVQEPSLTNEDIEWLTMLRVCVDCDQICTQDDGFLDGRTFRCARCQETRGNCGQCKMQNTEGKRDAVGIFYCLRCRPETKVKPPDVETSPASFLGRYDYMIKAALVQAVQEAAGGERVLEIASQALQGTELFAEVAIYVGASNSANGVEAARRAKEKLSRSSCHAEFLHDNPFQAEFWGAMLSRSKTKFDMIFCGSGVAHLLDIIEGTKFMLASAADCLQPEGIFFGVFFDTDGEADAQTRTLAATLERNASASELFKACEVNGLVPDAPLCQSFTEFDKSYSVLEDDLPLTPVERKVAGMLRTFVFRKV